MSLRRAASVAGTVVICGYVATAILAEVVASQVRGRSKISRTCAS